MLNSTGKIGRVEKRTRPDVRSNVKQINSSNLFNDVGPDPPNHPSIPSMGIFFALKYSTFRMYKRNQI